MSLLSKSKVMNGSEINWKLAGNASPVQGLNKYEAIYKGDTSDIHNVSGCRLTLDAVLVRTFPADNYKIAILLNGKWQDVEIVRRDCPMVAELEANGKLTTKGPSQREVEQEQQRSQRIAEQEEEASHRMRERSEVCKRRLEI